MVTHPDIMGTVKIAVPVIVHLLMTVSFFIPDANGASSLPPWEFKDAYAKYSVTFSDTPVTPPNSSYHHSRITWPGSAGWTITSLDGGNYSVSAYSDQQNSTELATFNATLASHYPNTLSTQPLQPSGRSSQIVEVCPWSTHLYLPI